MADAVEAAKNASMERYGDNPTTKGWLADLRDLNTDEPQTRNYREVVLTAKPRPDLPRMEKPQTFHQCPVTSPIIGPMTAWE